ncbi:Phospholipase [Salix suchowensis]|nr:Phospholipase [Salix suchowensis]
MSLSQIVELAREHHHRQDHTHNHEDKDSMSPWTTRETIPRRDLARMTTRGRTRARGTAPNSRQDGRAIGALRYPFKRCRRRGSVFPIYPERGVSWRPRIHREFRTERRKGKKRDSRINDESWNPIRWFSETPKEEKPAFISDEEAANGLAKGRGKRRAEMSRTLALPVKGKQWQVRPPRSLHLSYVAPRPFHIPRKTNPKLASQLGSSQISPTQCRFRQASPGPDSWTLRRDTSLGQHHGRADHWWTLNADVRLWFERDEKDHRRVPVLLHRLRIRVSDSLHPLHGNKSVYRIECEYANGAARWVVHRRLQDFISLHYHYAFSNAYNRNVENLPSFHAQVRVFVLCWTVLTDASKMFHPSANRISGFFEISALFISLAQSGGAQYKGGYLRIEETGNKVGDLVVNRLLTVWDVFLFDQDFKLERPKRYYRHPLNLLHQDGEGHLKPPDAHPRPHAQSEIDNKSVVASIKSKFSRVLPLGASRSIRRCLMGTDMVSMRRTKTPTTDLLLRRMYRLTCPRRCWIRQRMCTHWAAGADEEGTRGENAGRAEEEEGDVGGCVETYVFIENSQTRLKLFARNEVRDFDAIGMRLTPCFIQRQMLQWIAAFEKVKATSHWTGGNRFDSFAPIRLNVAAQWLVDGRLKLEMRCSELQMRRPNKERYRLDRLLERKAKEGVKIILFSSKQSPSGGWLRLTFPISLEVSNRTTPTDSKWFIV